MMITIMMLSMMFIMTMAMLPYPHPPLPKTLGKRCHHCKVMITMFMTMMMMLMMMMIIKKISFDNIFPVNCASHRAMSCPESQQKKAKGPSSQSAFKCQPSAFLCCPSALKRERSSPKAPANDPAPNFEQAFTNIAVKIKRTSNTGPHTTYRRGRSF